jgi:hypothetical protein
MSAELTQALDAVARRVVALAAQDAELRSHLRSLAQAVLSATAEPASEAEPPAGRPEPPATPPGLEESLPPPLLAFLEALESSPPTTAPSPEEACPAEASAPAARQETALKPAPEVTAPPRQGYPPRTPAGEIDLALVEARCRLKAEAARWAVTRRRLAAEGGPPRTEVEPRDRDLIGRAKGLPDCYLWMSRPEWPVPKDPSLVEVAAGCFETVAEGVVRVREAAAERENNPELFKQGLELLAEAQSGLRAAVGLVGGPSPDKDQDQVFAWLKATAWEQQVYIQRHMRADDVADPHRWAELNARIDALGGQLEEVRKRANRRKKLLGSLRYKVQRVAAGGEDGWGDGWQSVATTVDELVQAGVPPSNREVRELLLPVLDAMPEPDELPRGFQFVLREIDRYLASRPAPASAGDADEPTEAVRQVARLLAGHSVVLIGGERRPDSLEALKSSFRLRELYWVETREHQSHEVFEAFVARPDVVAVVLAIRWSSHSFGEVRRFCDEHRKPLVRLPGGYHPNQVAHQILSQCGERLAGKVEASPQEVRPEGR